MFLFCSALMTMSDCSSVLADTFAGLVHFPRRRYDALVVRFVELIPRSPSASFSRRMRAPAHPNYILLPVVLRERGHVSVICIAFVNCTPFSFVSMRGLARRPLCGDSHIW